MWFKSSKTNSFGTLDLEDLERKLKEFNPKLVSITAASNITGNIQPIKEICDLVHKYNSIAVIDGCQYVPHNSIDVKEIGCDFLAFLLTKWWAQLVWEYYMAKWKFWKNVRL